MKCFCGGKFIVETSKPVNERGKLEVDYPIGVVRYRKCEVCGFGFKTYEDVSAIREFMKIMCLKTGKIPNFW